MRGPSRRVLRASVGVVVPIGVGAGAEAGARAAEIGTAGASLFYATGVVATVVILWVLWRPVAVGPVRPRSYVAWGHGLGCGLARTVPFLVIAPGAFGTPTGRPVLVAIGLVLCAVVAEEMQFRGLLLDVVADGWSGRVGVVVSTLVFTALHVLAVPPLLLATVAADAVMFCALRRRSGLAGAVVAHAVFDVATVVFVPHEVGTLTQLAYVGCVVAVDAVIVATSRTHAVAAPAGRIPATAGAPS